MAGGGPSTSNNPCLAPPTLLRRRLASWRQLSENHRRQVGRRKQLGVAGAGGCGEVPHQARHHRLQQREQQNKLQCEDNWLRSAVPVTIWCRKQAARVSPPPPQAHHCHRRSLVLTWRHCVLCALCALSRSHT